MARYFDAALGHQRGSLSRRIVGFVGCSFQFGPTSMFLPPHLPHFTRYFRYCPSLTCSIHSTGLPFNAS
jgi:hypothetical protein